MNTENKTEGEPTTQQRTHSFKMGEWKRLGGRKEGREEREKDKKTERNKRAQKDGDDAAAKCWRGGIAFPMQSGEKESHELHLDSSQKHPSNCELTFPKSLRDGTGRRKRRGIASARGWSKRERTELSARRNKESNAAGRGGAGLRLFHTGPAAGLRRRPGGRVGTAAPPPPRDVSMMYPCTTTSPLES